MGFRFYKSFKIAPGLRFNLSKSGVSTSIGGKGATVNIGKRGIRTTVGIPGTGISYSTSQFSGKGAANRSVNNYYTPVSLKDPYYGILPFDTERPSKRYNTYGIIFLILFTLIFLITRNGGLFLLGVAGFFAFRSYGKSRDRIFFEEVVTQRAEDLTSALNEIALKDNINLTGIESLESIISNIKYNIQGVQNYLNSLETLYLLAEKYGIITGYKLYNHDYFIGMTKEQLYDCKGEPTKSEITADTSGVKETLIYGSSKQSGDWFVLQNEVVIKFVDK